MFTPMLNKFNLEDEPKLGSTEELPLRTSLPLPSLIGSLELFLNKNVDEENGNSPTVIYLCQQQLLPEMEAERRLVVTSNSIESQVSKNFKNPGKKT